jgi:ectoine hydroxylase-related dioxygenase (phytanoyl-CoA dioxygenase family)
LKSSLQSINERFHRDGFISGIPILSKGESLHHREQLERAEETLKHSLHYCNKVHKVMRSPYELATHPSILNIVEAILGPDILLYNATYIIKEPDSRTFVSWHQDLTYWGFDSSDQVSAWLALSPANSRSGCMQMIPGSHLEGTRAQETSDDPDNVLLQSQTITNIDESRAVSCELQPGEVSLHHGWTVHCSHPNLSGDRRLGLNAQYIRPSMRQTKSDDDSAMLVRGRDTFGYYRQEAAAQSWLEENAAQQLAIASEEYQDIAGRANPS